jgi:hypothetical protein
MLLNTVKEIREAFVFPIRTSTRIFPMKASGALGGRAVEVGWCVRISGFLALFKLHDDCVKASTGSQRVYRSHYKSESKLVQACLLLSLVDSFDRDIKKNEK